MDPTVDVVVETTQGSKHKYEYDHQRGATRLDRRLYSAVSFPADYGFVAGKAPTASPWMPSCCSRTQPSPAAGCGRGS